MLYKTRLSHFLAILISMVFLMSGCRGDSSNAQYELSPENILKYGFLKQQKNSLTLLNARKKMLQERVPPM